MPTQPITIKPVEYAPPALRFMAYRGDYDLDAPYALGSSPEEATQDLLDMEAA